MHIYKAVDTRQSIGYNVVGFHRSTDMGCIKIQMNQHKLTPSMPGMP